MKKCTDWMDGNTCPGTVGVYERKHESGRISYSFWNGMRWCYSCPQADLAYSLRGADSLYQEMMWRGLANKP